MHFLADENFPGDAVKALSTLGHDVVWIRSASPGICDKDVLSIAQNQERVILTFDKDFGELAFRFKLPAISGIILFRISTPSPDAAVRLVCAAVASRNDWRGHFSVVEDSRVRMTRLP